MINCKTILLAIFLTVHFCNAYAQTAEVYPMSWWTGMKWNTVQLLIRSDRDISEHKASIRYPGVSVLKTTPLENRKYLAVDIRIAPTAKPGKLNIELSGKNESSNNSQSSGSNRRSANNQSSANNEKTSIAWELKPKRKGNGTEYARGVSPADFIYLLMPDRFSNGDTTNDRIAGMRDQSLNRDSLYHRHGGDLQGIINHLDYLNNLGVTALWMTPVIENDMPDRTEHGYAFTNHYKIEPRLGGATAYRKLSDSLHARGMKLIQDAVYNHMGLYNFLMQDPPAKDWVHQWPEFTKPNYRDQVHFDPYASAADTKQMVDGWFTNEMPDLNQRNEYVSNLLIQHALWCVQEFGVDAWRIDTYIYVDLSFMNKCNKALKDEYPNITMFGESWVTGTANQAFFTKNTFDVKTKSNVDGTIDFQTLFRGILPALTQGSDGVNQLYQTLGNDFLYHDAMTNVIFLDNHDMTRFFSAVQEDVRKQKIGVQWLLTERGIPQMYYGTEVLMKGVSDPDGWVRLDFPGGWRGDQKNAFTGDGLTAQEREMQAMTRKLAGFRKTSSALTAGRRMHFVPRDGLYVYFRFDTAQTVMCVMNTAEEKRPVDFAAYSERTSGFRRAVDVVSGAEMDLATKTGIGPLSMWVLELKR